MPTVDRVLPWRRGAVPAEEIAPLLSTYRARHPKAPTALISRAYAEAANAHTGQLRNSGEPYIEHPLSVAMIIADSRCITLCCAVSSATASTPLATVTPAPEASVAAPLLTGDAATNASPRWPKSAMAATWCFPSASCR